MSSLRDQAIVWSARLGLPRLFGGAPEGGVTSLLFHRFRFGDETWWHARERLRRQLDCLLKRVDAVPIEALLDASCSGAHGRPRTLVTIDDALLDTLEVAEVFRQFAVPVVQFVCVGWTEQASASEDPLTLKVRLAALLHLYRGPSETVTVGSRLFQLENAGNKKLIDAIICASDEELTSLAAWELQSRHAVGPRTVCNWSELRDLQAGGMAIGCHSVSHPRIAQQAPLRQQFEIAASKSLVERHHGTCRWFAYPYGTDDSHSPATYAICRELGFDAVFTTTPGVVSAPHDRLRLPRIAMPDAVLPVRLFDARARGGGIPMARIKEWLA